VRRLCRLTVEKVSLTMRPSTEIILAFGRHIPSLAASQKTERSEIEWVLVCFQRFVDSNFGGSMQIRYLRLASVFLLTTMCVRLHARAGSRTYRIHEAVDGGHWLGRHSD